MSTCWNGWQFLASLQGRRYSVVGSGPHFLIVYAVTDTDAFTSPPYLERLYQPSDRTRQVMPSLRNMCRRPHRRGTPRQPRMAFLRWSTVRAVGGGLSLVAEGLSGAVLRLLQ